MQENELVGGREVEKQESGENVVLSSLARVYIVYKHVVCAAVGQSSLKDGIFPQSHKLSRLGGILVCYNPFKDENPFSVPSPWVHLSWHIYKGMAF